jgi:methionyl-tRNA formyltransferase
VSVLRVVFFGTPEFAVPALEALAASSEIDIALVVTQGANAASPVERAALRLGLPVYKPATLRDPVSRAPLLEANADLFVVAAFGLIFGKRTLALPRLGAVNIHPSLLPRYRGATPIPAAVMEGVGESGVSLMLMDEGIDTGTVISQEREAVGREDTAASLSARLARIGAVQAARDIPRWARDEIIAQPQAGPASLTRTLTKADGWVDWTRGAAAIERQVRAMWPWPRAWTTVDGSPLQIHESSVADITSADLAPGTVIPTRQRLIVACGDGALELITIEPAARRAMSAAAYLNGRRAPLARLGEVGAPPQQPPLIVPVRSANRTHAEMNRYADKLSYPQSPPPRGSSVTQGARPPRPRPGIPSCCRDRWDCPSCGCSSIGRADSTV